MNLVQGWNWNLFSLYKRYDKIKQFFFYIPPKLIPFSIGLVQCAFVYSLSLLFLLDLAVPSRGLGTPPSWAPSHIGQRLTKNKRLCLTLRKGSIFQNSHFILAIIVKEDHLRMNNSTGSNNHLKSRDLFRSMII